MAQTLVSLLAHIIFSTKHREPLLRPQIEPELFAYIGGILNNNGCRLLEAGGTANHVHLLVSLSKNVALSSLMKDVKKDSSSWIKTKGNEFRNFHWQDGYGAFSVGVGEVVCLKKYIARQKEHHRKRSFQEELIEFLNEYRNSIRRTLSVDLIRPFQGRGSMLRYSGGVATGYEFVRYADVTISRQTTTIGEGLSAQRDCKPKTPTALKRKFTHISPPQRENC